MPCIRMIFTYIGTTLCLHSTCIGTALSFGKVVVAHSLIWAHQTCGLGIISALWWGCDRSKAVFLCCKESLLLKIWRVVHWILVANQLVSFWRLSWRKILNLISQVIQLILLTSYLLLLISHLSLLINDLSLLTSYHHLLLLIGHLSLLIGHISLLTSYHLHDFTLVQ